MEKKFNFDNFFSNTIANFVNCEIPKTPPDFISKSGSFYWGYEDKVVRWSNHWGIIGTCVWQLWANDNCFCGECFYTDFRKKEY